MKRLRTAVVSATSAFLLAAGAAITAVPAFSAPAPEQGQGQALITVLPKKDNEARPNVTQQDVQLKVNGKASDITSFSPAQGAGSPLELVLMIDGGARTSLGTQMADIQKFVKEMPSHTKMTIAYMENGRAALTGPFSSDPAAVLRGLHLPNGFVAQSASPYFCLSDLAKHWPSQDPTARREVVMVTDGVDYYQLRYDPGDPYVMSAINDAVRAHVVVYSIYWVNKGRIDRTWYESNAGQNLLNQVTEATGGNSYWEGVGNPVSFDPYFKDLRLRFENQYRIGFNSPLKGKPDVERMNLKVGGLVSAKVYAPQQVFVQPQQQQPSGE
ncbi:MAG TPA: hypothetical protein VKR52_15625 [Terracidiphilus sp.]|nr:hypothetical protein [Terracidiphilus sp.]